jgi:hypothetical protein
METERLGLSLWDYLLVALLPWLDMFNHIHIGTSTFYVFNNVYIYIYIRWPFDHVIGIALRCSLQPPLPWLGGGRAGIFIYVRAVVPSLIM